MGTGPAGFFCSFSKYRALGTGLEQGLSKTQTRETSALLGLTFYRGKAVLQ